ncbi:MAG: DHH family phosphoesterase [bacterium]
MDHHLIRNIFNKDDVGRAWTLIQQAQAITLLTHDKPDGDGVSACAAVSLLLEKLGKKTETIYPSKPEFEIKRQSKHVLINKHSFVPDLIIACDTANYGRLYFPDDFKSIQLINIDHHISNKIKGTINFVSEYGVASSCEQVYHLVLGWNADALDKQMAEILLFGLLYDSQVFYTKATNSNTLKIAAELIDKGANLFSLQAELLQNKDPQIIALWGHVLSNVCFSKTKKSAWVVITQKELQQRGLDLASLVGLSNFLAQLSQTDVTALFYEDKDGRTKVSFRSKKADVNAFAAQFGGGGHTNASGIWVDEPIVVVVKKVTALFV